jgi:methylated-DNA-protein-cysteine methyltransferase-like protein
MPRGQNLYFRIYNTVRKIPPGKVATYGQIAQLLNAPRSARIVGWALRSIKPGSKVPWQRVINKAGMISIENMRAPKEQQAYLLKQEGVEVTQDGGNYWVDLKKYLWDPGSE